ncbi:hypothetical protein [Flavicella sp.]|uniref:hypothetical protein n=1 Tax=Flavicella sp. TaxID=2957742 RepID=UPI00301A31EA
MYNQGPFADWVPKPVMLLLILIFICPILAISGVYSNNILDVTRGLATYTEYILLANNATTIGMGIAIIIVLRIKTRFRSKEIITASTIALAFLSYTIGATDNPLVVVIGSFFIGFFKMFPMIEMILPLMFIITPKGERGKFYAIFYTLSICITQLTAYLMANLISNSNWQAPYYIMSILMLIIASLSLIFQHNQRFSFKVPLYQLDWVALVLLSISAMSFNIGFTFMRQQGWFSSPYIVGFLLIGFILFIYVMYKQKFVKRKLINFNKIIKKVNVWHSIILLMLMGIYLASSSIFTNYTVGVLGYNSLITAKLNLWQIPGIILAGVYAFYSFKYNWKLKYYIASGFIAYFIHTFMLYLSIQPQMNIEYLYIPMIMKGAGVGILFIGIWFYGSNYLELYDLFGILGILLIIRTFIATASAGALISWATYQGQWQSLNDMSSYLDIGAFPNGIRFYKTSQISAILASSKIVLGSLCWLIVPILIFVLTHHYGQFNYRRVILFKKIIRGNSIKGYKYASK